MGILKKTEQVLHAKMFGNFSLQYNENPVSGQKTSETQFACLMQIVLHHRKSGVSREMVEEVLFGDRDIENPHHALSSVIYNARKKLEKSGLPKCTYIVVEKGVLYWTKEIPVEEDAEKFEKLFEQGNAAVENEERLRLLTEATHYYTGEFLGSFAGVLWAVSEARRYRAMFYRCIEEIVYLLRDRQDYIQMEKIGRYAVKAAPFSDWESIVIEALIGMGKYEEANRYYADTVQLYLEERGMRPSQKLLDSLQQLGDQFIHPGDSLEHIQENLGESGEGTGPYICNYPVFQGVYQVQNRIAERSGQSMYLMLCTIVDSKGNPMREGKQLEELSDRLGEAILCSIRRSDVVNQYGKGQYLVLLLNITLENCRLVQKRIDSHFLIGRQRTGVDYQISSTLHDVCMHGGE